MTTKNKASELAGLTVAVQAARASLRWEYDNAAGLSGVEAINALPAAEVVNLLWAKYREMQRRFQQADGLLSMRNRDLALVRAYLSETWRGCTHEENERRTGCPVCETGWGDTMSKAVMDHARVKAEADPEPEPVPPKVSDEKTSPAADSTMTEKEWAYAERLIDLPWWEHRAGVRMVQPSRGMSTRAVPDLTDPATIGVLLLWLRERWQPGEAVYLDIHADDSVGVSIAVELLFGAHVVPRHWGPPDTWPDHMRADAEAERRREAAAQRERARAKDDKERRAYEREQLKRAEMFKD